MTKIRTKAAAKPGGNNPDGRPSRFKGKSARPASFSLTDDAKAILADAAKRAGVSRSDIVEALIRSHGRTIDAALVIDGRIAS